jgi:hypothetical protein
MCRNSFLNVEKQPKHASIVEIHYIGLVRRNPFFSVEKCHHHDTGVEIRLKLDPLDRDPAGPFAPFRQPGRKVQEVCM